MLYSSVFLFPALLYASAFSAPAQAPELRPVSLVEALQLAETRNAGLRVQSKIVEQAEARTHQASAASYPKVLGTAILSPMYDVTGDALHSENHPDRWGMWLQSTVTLLQPLFAFGRISSLKEAAGEGWLVAQAGRRRSSDELRFDVKQAYWGAVLADQMVEFLAEGKKELDGVLERAEQDQNKKKPSIAKRDLFRLKIFEAEALYRLAEATKLRSLARRALSYQLGFAPETETMPADINLTALPDSIPTESALHAQLMRSRPELDQLTHGIRAKQSLLASESANKYPAIFVGGMFTFAYSNVRTPQNSAYAFDPYNRHSGGAGVGLQWSWDFATTLANESMLRAEIAELEAKQDQARSGFRLELHKALGELEEAHQRLSSSKEAFQVGRRWLISETMGYSVGLGEIKNLIDAYLARAKTAKDYWESIFKWNMAWAELSKTVGEEVAPSLTKH